MTQILQFFFVVALPVVLVAGGLATLFLVGALLDALENLDELRSRIEAAFRKPPKPPRGVADDHYYKPYWNER